MKLFHKLKAASLRRKLIRQRAQNIADIRHGRSEARAIRRDMVRHSRLANTVKPADDPATTESAFHPQSIGRRLSLVVQALPKLRRAA